MLKNKTINLGIVKKVANALGELNEQVAYVGGATVSLYADDPAADDVRPTKDIDIVLHILTFGELTALQERLGQKGIQPDPESKVICRFKYDDILIDVMSIKEVGWAPSNIWFEPGFRNLETYSMDNETTIRIFPISYFLATKFAAFHDRGIDPRTSKDFEDIVYLLDNRLNLVDELLSSSDDVRSYLAFELHELQHADKVEAIQAHLSPFTNEDRYAMIQDRIKQIVNGP
jgi:predicted nucleotidyltransferase